MESDSQLIILALGNSDLVPWTLKNRWLNCVELTKGMRFTFSHIYREGNACADKLAEFGLLNLGFRWWDSIPDFIIEDFSQNRNGLPSYRFT